MKIRTTFAAALAVLSIALLCGCSSEPHKAKIICHEYDEDANDGAVSRNCKTTIEVVDTGHRMIWTGNYGPTGDVFTVYNHHIPDSVWSSNP